ncbi:hypothetical protein M8J76_000138 [Diaphorina citri]|nr:hypothetical protein M8J76_000138 [Diaphorina citri]
MNGNSDPHLTTEEVRQLECLCKQLYESADGNLRVEAEKALVNFQNAPDTLAKCQLLLDRGDSSYAQAIAANTLTKLISRPAQGLSLQQRIDIRNYILNYLATRPKLPNFVIQALVTLFARITKLGWFDSEKDEFVFRNVIQDVSNFLQILSQLTGEMNQISEADAARSLTKHRKIASSYRDIQLFDIFRLSCSLLSNAQENCKTMTLEGEGQIFMTQLLGLAQNCLTFDFIGTATDESSDDLCTALACLVQIASVRRSLFSNAERARFLTQLVNGVKQILQNPQGLSDANNYHEFCRLLARLKSNYQLGELVMVDNYSEAIQLIAKFTVESLQMWQFAPNSVHYLLSLWQRMVASVPYIKAMEPHQLHTYTPEVTSAYITSRLDSVAVVIRDNLEDPLDDLGMVSQQLEQLSAIGRCEYQKTCSLLVQLFDQSARLYQELISTPSPNQIDIAIQEGRLTWLVYIIGAAVGGRVSFNSNEDHDAMDGELVCRVLQLMNLTDPRLLGPGPGCEKLELAMLSFFEQFRKIYVGDQVQKNSKVYRRLNEVLGLCDEATVLSVFVRKIITNLKYWGRSEQIITKTLQLLNDLSVGYSCVRKLVKLDEVQFMLNNHTSEHFPFLGNNVADVSEMRCRSMFYTSLGRLLMVDLGEDEDRFEAFMLPLTNKFFPSVSSEADIVDKFKVLQVNNKVICHRASVESFGNMSGNIFAMAAESPSMFVSEETKKALIGLARDLRGLAFAFNTKTSYMMLFDWIYPVYTPIFLAAVERWYAEPEVTTPILKLFAELVQNRSQRLQFDVSSPNGILLFREASKIICSYGSRILSVEVPDDKLYSHKLKGISICFSMLKAALCGGYVNFGVFRLYGDEALDNALKTFDYPKLSQTYYVLLECLAQDHMSFLASLEPTVFLYILSSISEGLTALDTMVCTGCCATLDHIVTYLFKQITNKGKKKSGRPGASPTGTDMFLQVLEVRPEILQQILSTVLNIIMFEDCRNQWSMSRPLLGLILLNEEYFNQLRENIVRGQPPDKQASMVQWFENLMNSIERNLLTKNRDRFTQNLSMFRRDINDSLKGPNMNSSCTANDMMT